MCNNAGLYLATYIVYVMYRYMLPNKMSIANNAFKRDYYVNYYGYVQDTSNFTFFGLFGL